MATTVILDCDNACGIPGCDVDDALTLAYLLGRDDITLAGVTCVYGNTGVTRVHRQTAKLLSRANATDIPLVAGAARAGDQDTAAARFLARTVAERPGQIVILATGPLTNIAAAAAYDPDFFKNVRAIHCMGGYFGAQHVGFRAAGELNLSADAAASRTVLNSGATVSLFVTEVCKQLSFRWRDFPLLRGLDRMFARHLLSWLVLYGIGRGIGRFYMWDVLPALLITHPEAFGSVVVGSDVDSRALQAGQVVLRQTTGTVRAPQTLRDAKRLRRDIAAAWRTALPARPGRKRPPKQLAIMTR